jgi:uncharacterized protein YcbX
VVIEGDLGALGPIQSGRRIQIGEVEVRISKGCTRCVMTTRPQPDGLERQLDILRHAIRFHDNQVGLRATVVRSGMVHLGDQVVLVD